VFRFVFRFVVVSSLLALPLIAAGQGFFGFGTRTAANPPYDSRFIFTRMRYPSGSWSHDYPTADIYLTEALDDLTRVSVNRGRSNVLTFSDPELFANPIVYVSEPGFWTLAEDEVANLRAYLLKGGLIIFDDFEGEAQWGNMAAQMARALPQHRFENIDVSHPVFHSLFDLKALTVPHPSVAVTPEFRAMFLNNDRSGPMVALANYNSDLAEYWEWSAREVFPVEITSGAYEMGVNYIVYGMTH
jgi:hypothetical protein